MDFGKRDDVDRVDFTLPAPVGEPVGPAGPLRVWIGCPSWNAGLDALWPARTPAREHLSRYAGRFPAVELNATFHALPERARVEAWAREVGGPFRFCAKVPRSVSHDAERWVEDAPAFARAWEGFGESAGPAFFQAPPECAPWHLGELLARIDALGPAVGAVEVRHPGWFVKGALIPALDEALRARGLGTCISDTPGRRDVVHGSLPATRMVLRFMGVPGHPSTPARLAGWAAQARRWREQGLRELYLFVHQPENLGLLELAGAAEAAFAEERVIAEARGSGGPAGTGGASGTGGSSRQVGLFG